MAVTLTNGEIELYADVAFEALLENIAMFDSIATNFSSGLSQVGDIEKVDVYSATDQPAAFNISTNNYEDSAADGVTFVDVALDQRIKSTMGITDDNAPKVDKRQLIRNHIQAMWKEIQTIIMGNITNANFGAAAFTGLASTFDSDDVADLWAAAEGANFSDDKRFLVLGTDYYTALLKDDNLKKVNEAGTEESLRRSEVTMLNGFILEHNKYIPDNSENLVGYITDMSGLAAASGLIVPQSSASNIVDWRVITDPNSNFSLGQRTHYDPATGSEYVTWETLFGSAVAQAGGLKRIISAAP